MQRKSESLFKERILIIDTQLHVGVESIRVPELLFQPSMIGVSEAGLAELMDFVLHLFTPEEQKILAANVYVTGACSQIPGKY